LREWRGNGQTGVAWRAEDSLRRPWVIKFVLRCDYRTHALDAEAQRVAKLSSNRVPRIDFFGVPRLQLDLIDPTTVYALVVEWVPGRSFASYVQEFGHTLTPPVFLLFTRAFCEILSDLQSHRLSHNDLHAENVLVSPTRDLLSGDTAVELRAIDTGSLTTEERRLELIEQWQ